MHRPICISNNVSVALCNQEIRLKLFKMSDESFPAYRNKGAGNIFLFPLDIQLQDCIYIMVSTFSNEHVLHVSTFLEILH